MVVLGDGPGSGTPGSGGDEGSDMLWLWWFLLSVLLFTFVLFFFFLEGGTFFPPTDVLTVAFVLCLIVARHVTGGIS